MSQISYELKRKKLCEAQKYSRFKLQGILALIFVVLFFAYRANFGKFWFLYLLVLGFFCYVVYIYCEKKLENSQNAKENELFNNEFLVGVAKELNFTFQPFGAFFINDFDDTAFQKGANLAVCNQSIIGKIGQGEAKFGDLRLVRDFKRKKKFFDLDKIFSRINDGAIFDGFVAKFNYAVPFNSEMEVVLKGEAPSANLKLLKQSGKLSEIFDIYVPDGVEFLQNGGVEVVENTQILAKLQAVMENLIGSTALYLKGNSVIIAVENKELFRFNKNEKDVNAKLLESMKLMMQIAKNLENNREFL